MRGGGRSGVEYACANYDVPTSYYYSYRMRSRLGRLRVTPLAPSKGDENEGRRTFTSLNSRLTKNTGL